jgi:hypothetical protein
MHGPMVWWSKYSTSTTGPFRVSNTGFCFILNHAAYFDLGFQKNIMKLELYMEE